MPPSLLQAGSKDLASVWAAHTFNLSHYGVPKNFLQPPRLTGFYPLGFSEGGWFAYFHHPEREAEPERRPSLSSGISLVNIRCPGAGECISDSPSSKDDLCYCPPETTLKGLFRYGVRPFDLKLRHGSFPAKILGEDYEVKTVYTKNIIPSEMRNGGKFPGTEVFLVPKKGNNRLIAVIDHNHSGALEGTVQATGWMETPRQGTVIIVVSYITGCQSPKEAGCYVSSQPVAVELAIED